MKRRCRGGGDNQDRVHPGKEQRVGGGEEEVWKGGGGQPE